MTVLGNEGVAGRVQITEVWLYRIRLRAAARPDDGPVAKSRWRFCRAGAAALSDAAANMPVDGRQSIADLRREGGLPHRHL